MISSYLPACEIHHPHLCQQNLSFACSISEYSRKTPQESNKIKIRIYSFVPKVPALATAGSVMTIGARLTSPDCGKVIQAEPLFLILD